MMRQTKRIGRIPNFKQLRAIAGFLAWFVALGESVRSQDFLAEFEGPETSWKILGRQSDARTVIHNRRRGMGKTGGAEFIRISPSRENSVVNFEHTVPAATVLDELEASLWIKANHDGFFLKVKVTLPEVVDPESRKPLTFLITGDQYTTPGQWQQLRCATSEREVSNNLRLLRARKQISINPRLMFVDTVVVSGQLPPGESDVYFDNLSLRPLVRFELTDTASGDDRSMNQRTEDQQIADGRADTPVEFRLHRLFVNGAPFFPRIVTYQQERPNVLSTAGINVAWVQDYENTSVTLPLRRQGLWVTAMPPYAKGIDGEPLDSEEASLLPFQANSAPVLFWMLGARMSPHGRPRIASWTNQVRDADRHLIRRPIAADVIENERLCSRQIDMLGISRHVIQTDCSLNDYRDWIIQRRNQAWPDTFCWTWIQTEPAPQLKEATQGVEYPPMLEPEQIRLQVYAALAAGCRGIGYWTTIPLDHDSPAAKERLLMIRQLNLELDLLEPWITSSGTPQLVTFKIDMPRSDQPAAVTQATTIDPKKKSRVVAPEPKPDQKPKKRELQAAMIRSELGALLLPMWLEDGAQFTPGPMGAYNVPIIIPGGVETAAAWEITTAGKLRHLDRIPAAGGVQVKLTRFDQTAAILVTSKQSTVDELNEKIAAMQEQSARILVELARSKLERTRQVDEVLRSLNVGRRDSWQWLGDAKILLDKADMALKSQQPAEARQFANEAMQLARLLQRAHWDFANRRMASSTSNPCGVSFQSLPEYWRTTRQIESLGCVDSLPNLLPSGEFEDVSTMLAEHWKNEQAMTDSVESGADLYRVAKQGSYSLRLSASPMDGTKIPAIMTKAPVTMVSPPISVRAGQVVRITGWAKVPADLLGCIDGAMIYDSLLGKPGAVRLKGTQDWKRFELIRPVHESQDITVTLSLNGLGELLIDDLRVTTIDPGEQPTPPPTNQSPVTPTKYSTLENIRRLNPLQRRQ